jgi:tetratricopeptide (TPR) repeat protein
MNWIPEKIGRYEIIDEIGRGGMGVVYKARDPNIGRLVALKVIKSAFGADDESSEELKKRFQREVRAAGIIQHPNIVAVYDADEDQGVPYLTMEYVKGVTVDTIIVPGRPLPLEQTHSIMEQVTGGLTYAHEKGIIHRDIKPANLILAEDGTVKITDFGIAKFVNTELTQGKPLMGSPNYMNPEQLTGGPVDARSDVFSLGVVLYEFLTGHKPFMGENPSSVGYQIVKNNPTAPSRLNPSLPPAYDRVVKKALAKDPDRRYASAQELAKDLSGLAPSPEQRAGGAGNGLGRLAMGAYWARFTHLWRRPGVLPGLLFFLLSILLCVMVFLTYRVSNPYVRIQEHLAEGRDDRALMALMTIHAQKPKDHRATCLLGHVYARLGDYRSSLMAYSQALVISPECRNEPRLQDDLVQALSQPEAHIAVELMVTHVNGAISHKLTEALKDRDFHTHWNAAKALSRMDRKVDELPLLILDLKYNDDCTIRKAAADRLGQLKDSRALAELEQAKADNRNTRACMGKTLDLAMEKINEANKTKP